jgi:hypothetical protein
MEGIMHYRSLLVGIVIGSLFAIATLVLTNTGAVPAMQFLIYFLVPGLVLSMAVSGNVHAFHLWVAALGNLAFWLLLCWLVGSIIGRIRRKRDVCRAS